jgi:hypothetical protein
MIPLGDFELIILTEQLSTPYDMLRVVNNLGERRTESAGHVNGLLVGEA